jgi:hypothetical protein
MQQGSKLIPAAGQFPGKVGAISIESGCKSQGKIGIALTDK